MPKRDSLSLPQLTIIIVTLLALALGGTTELWAQATIAGLAGLLLLLAPAQRAPGRLPVLLFLLLFALALAAYLPAGWGPSPPWRRHLVGDLGAQLPFTRTGQPWITAQACGLFFIGLAWAAYVLSQSWNSDQRLRAVQCLVAGIALLSTLAVVAFVSGWRVPIWHHMENRGWFPNRNQTGDVLALGGILAYALGFDRLRKKDASGGLWLGALLVICAGLVVAYSRSGILMFFAGICLWHWLPGQRQKISAKWLTLSLTAVLTLLTLFFLFGGETLERFQGHGIDPALKTDFRVAVQGDAFWFSLQSPWLGVGLGNFEALFPFSRHASINQQRAIHPESDWLWAICEMGWPAALLLFMGIFWWAQRAFPYQMRSGESIRRALTLAVVMFILHGFVDVSGHRIGSMFTAILLASLALPAAGEAVPPRGAPLAFRGLAVALLGIAAGWFASIRGAAFPPTTATLERIEGGIQAASDQGRVADMNEMADAGLRIAPLYWPLYYQRGYSEVFQPGKLSQAVTDFHIARALEPNWIFLCLNEGSVWLAANQPDYCMDAWLETLRRAGPKAPNFYADMFDRAASNHVIRARLREWAQDNPECLIRFLFNSSPWEAKSIIDHQLSTDPGLKMFDDEQRTLFFQAWWARGDQADLIARLLKNDQWLESGWTVLAVYYSKQGDFQKAWQVIDAHQQPPSIPPANSDQPVEDLKRTFYSQPDNLAAGLMLALLQVKKDQTDDALATLNALEKIPNHPRYIYYLQARQWAAKQQWELAWNAWARYQGY